MSRYNGEGVTQEFIKNPPQWTSCNKCPEMARKIKEDDDVIVYECEIGHVRTIHKDLRE